MREPDLCLIDDCFEEATVCTKHHDTLLAEIERLRARVAQLEDALRWIDDRTIRKGKYLIPPQIECEHDDFLAAIDALLKEKQP